MSWQRVLELARRQGMPVIVTDPAGREPVVILPLEAYEALTEALQGRIEPAPVRSTLSPASEIHIPVASASPETTKVTETPAIKTPAFSLETIEIATAPVQESVSGEDLSMEERFYLEPVDEETGA